MSDSETKKFLVTFTAEIEVKAKSFDEAVRYVGNIPMPSIGAEHSPRVVESVECGEEWRDVYAHCTTCDRPIYLKRADSRLVDGDDKEAWSSAGDEHFCRACYDAWQEQRESLHDP